VVFRDLGRKVGIINPHPPRKRSRELLAIPPTLYKQIRPSGLALSQFPRTLTDAQGKIRKPQNW
jgi:hypothetical protein